MELSSARDVVLIAEAEALAKLNALSSRLWTMHSVREGLEEILDATIALLGAGMGNVQVLDPARSVLTIAAQRGFDESFLDFFREVSADDDSVCARALRSGERVVIEDVDADAAFAPLRGVAHAAGYRAVQSTPLIGRNGVLLGMLSTHFRTVHRPTELQLRCLDLYVRLTADYLERSRSDEALRESGEKFRVLFDSLDEGFCIIEFLDGPHGPLSDYVHVAANPAYATNAGIPDIVGQKVREMVPDEAEGWVEIYRKVLITGERVRFERELVATGRHLELSAFRIEPVERRQVAVVFKDVTERKRTQDALRASEEQLREADRRKDEFLALLAHELRNPLAPIRTGLELIRVAGDTPGSVARVRHMMERQIGHMVRLIDDLLDVSRITSGKIQLRREPIPLAGVVNSAIDANRAAFEAKQIQLHVDLPDTVFIIDVDPTRFIQVVSNLLHNSTKFTEPGGSIRVSARANPLDSGSSQMVTLSVLDTGMGIPATLLPRVFDLFTQGDGASSHPGLGIGLALAQRLVEMQGGRIDARSDGPGHGSEFTIEMPLSEKIPRVRATETNRPDAINARVMVIDDNRDAAEVMAMLIEELGGECRVAFNGESGLRQAVHYRPDIVLLDIGMPGVDGYDTCRRIRHALGDDVVIVAVTGLGQEQDKERAADAGFNAHLTKPADPAAVEKVLRSAGRRPENKDFE